MSRSGLHRCSTNSYFEDIRQGLILQNGTKIVMVVVVVVVVEAAGAAVVAVVRMVGWKGQ